ncbi:MAG: polyphosphate kinase 1, partial [Pseudomonadota bacterium]
PDQAAIEPDLQALGVDKKKATKAAKATRPRHVKFADKALYINREVSVLEFNKRVLALARDNSIPLLERLFYLCICSSNLDEFFEVRVAGLQKQARTAGVGTGPDQLTPEEQLAMISQRAHRLVRQQYKVLNQELLPALAAEGIGFMAPEDWNKSIAQWASDFFDNELLPVLSPLGLDPAHPFPQLTNKSLNFIVSLKGKDAFGRDTSMAVVRAPRSLPRVIALPENLCEGEQRFVLLSTMIEQHMANLFPGLQTRGVYQFRLTRNSDLYLADEDIADLRLALQDELNSRDYGQAVRLEVDSRCPSDLVEFLLAQFSLSHNDLYVCDGPVNLNRLQQLPELINRPSLKFAPYKPRLSEKPTFASLRPKDMLLHYPYQSVDSVVALLQSAADDPEVVAIKQTLYRTDNVYADALIQAARNGKDVTVVIELRARFDEEANIAVATRLQHAGVQVVYGVVGYKTHAKMMLFVRREKGRLARYAHIATGNYHTRTSGIYTDLGLLTSNKAITGDIQKVFNQLTGLGKVANMKKILHAPFTMRVNIIELIEQQAELAQQGKSATIKARMNALNDESVIRALYRASCAGVKIKLLVRGV